MKTKNMVLPFIEDIKFFLDEWEKPMKMNYLIKQMIVSFHRTFSQQQQKS